jgi:glycosyltransferase involved in cell wall biosynthesis
MIRILHVVTSIDPSLGGVAESIVRRGEELVAMGHQVEVVSLDDPDNPALSEYPLPLHALGTGLTAWCYSPKLIPWLRSNCRRFDAVIIDGIWQYHATATRRALRGSGVPYFVFPHGMLDPWFKRTYPLKHLKKWLFWPWAEYRVLRDAKAVLFTCKEECRLANQSFWLYRAKEMVVDFGTAPPPTNKEELHLSFLTEFPQLANKRILLFLGRIHAKKGCDLLIEAYSRVASQFPSVDLAIAGPCDLHLLATLQSQASTSGLSQRVHWLGMLKGPLKWGALYASAAFVLPSHQENFGIAVVEAMSCGLPVLISNKVNIWTEVASGGAGYIDNDTVHGTHRILVQWLSATDEELAQLSSNAVATFQRHFTIRAMATGLLDAVMQNVDTMHQ